MGCRALLYIAFVTVSLHTTLADETEKTIEKLFADSFKSEEIYKKSMCSKNTLNFLKKLKEKGVDLKDINVLFITQQIGKGLMLLPENSRGRETEWGHHVVLEYKGKIVDFDYTNEPKIVSAGEYFFEMWVPTEMKKHQRNVDLMSELIKLRSIPAKDYLENDLKKFKAQDYVDGKTEPNYPLVTLAEFFEKKKLARPRVKDKSNEGTPHKPPLARSRGEGTGRQKSHL